MSKDQRLAVTKQPKPRSLLRQGYSVVGGVTHGVSSVAKTSLMRRDRVSDAFYKTRLSICQDCPGGHAKFHKNGSLSTCGPMLKSLRGEGQQTCGCVLSQKARDVKESCPFGYWPTLDGAEIRDQQQQVEAPPVVPGLAYDLLSRRHFIGTALGALASAVVVRPSWAAEDDACYMTLAACGPNGQSGAYTDCSAVEGWEIGKVYEGSDGECYTLSGNPPSSQPGTNQVTLHPGAKHDCVACEPEPCTNPCSHNECCFSETSTALLTITIGGSDHISDGTYSFELPIRTASGISGCQFQDESYGQKLLTGLQDANCLAGNYIYADPHLYFEGNGKWSLSMHGVSCWDSVEDNCDGECLTVGLDFFFTNMTGDCCGGSGSETYYMDLGNDGITASCSFVINGNSCCKDGSSCVDGSRDCSTGECT